jgi:hypothetical protein
MLLRYLQRHIEPQYGKSPPPVPEAGFVISAIALFWNCRCVTCLDWLELLKNPATN